jgi:hypothetical protein
MELCDVCNRRGVYLNMGWIEMKKYLLISLLISLVIWSSSSNGTHKTLMAAEPQSTATYVSAQPLAGRKVRISISAKEKSLYIANCNEQITVALFKNGSNIPVWGGASDACLSQSIIVPAKSTLSFIINTADGSPDLDIGKQYKAQIYDVHRGLDIKSPKIPYQLVTSHEFKLVP